MFGVIKIMELIFFRTKGGSSFLGFAWGLVCAFANVITFTKQINFKDPGGEDGQPSQKNIVINFIALIFHILIIDKSRSACFSV